MERVKEHKEGKADRDRRIAEAYAFCTHRLQADSDEKRYFSTPRAISSGVPRYQFPWDSVSFPPHSPSESGFTFIDLFAGIGGMRLAGHYLGGRCVFSSEWDRFAQRVYWRNFGEVPFGDIRPIAANAKKRIPDHNLLFAGFPCQAFSIAGKRGGFEDTRGTLFFEVASILDAKKPDVAVLENVKGLVGHHRGRTLGTILNTLNEIGYHTSVSHEDSSEWRQLIMNAFDYGLAQNRERVVIVAFRNREALERFRYPKRLDSGSRVRDVLHSVDRGDERPSAKYYLSETYLDCLKRHRARHQSKGNGFGYVVVPPEGIAGAVVCGGMGRERNLVRDDGPADRTPITNIRGRLNSENIRRMTPREWARLQGFPDEFQFEDAVSDTQAYKQFGNSVPVPMIQAVTRQALEAAGLVE